MSVILWRPPHLPMSSAPAIDANVGSQSVECIILSYSVPHASDGRWLLDHTNAGTWIDSKGRQVMVGVNGRADCDKTVSE